MNKLFPTRTVSSRSLRVGNTPLKRVYGDRSLGIYAKLEWYNPFGSVKDRAAYYMIRSAEARGDLKPRHTVVIEPTSGNTGIALAGIAGALGYEVEVVVPSQVSVETKMLLRRMEARVWEAEDDLCPRVGRGTDQAISLAHGLVKSYEGRYFMPNQYENQDNVKAHYETTGPEIWRQTGGRVTHFVAGVGTGGTIVGVGKFLKERNSEVKVYAVEPMPGHNLQGLRNLQESDTPKILEEGMDVIDDWIKVSDDDAFKRACELFADKGVPAGPSSGAAYYGALTIAENVKKGFVVTVFPDSRHRHESTFNKWIKGELKRGK
ncbi:MAG: cysteine synthase family protein [Candidatus Bathyarchaeia archaeon]